MRFAFSSVAAAAAAHAVLLLLSSASFFASVAGRSASASASAFQAATTTTTRDDRFVALTRSRLDVVVVAPFDDVRRRRPASALLRRRSSSASRRSYSSSSSSSRLSVHASSSSSLPLLQSLSSLQTQLSSPLVSVSILAFVVLVHESGHFLAARTLGVRVREFSVGVGPKLLGFRRDDDTGRFHDFGFGGEVGSEEMEREDLEKGGIEFSLRAVPLGGYVRFPENYNGTEAMRMEDEARAWRKAKREERRRSERRAATGGGEGTEKTTRKKTKAPMARLVGVVTDSLGGRRKAREEEEEVRSPPPALERQREAETKKNWWNLGARARRPPQPAAAPLGPPPSTEIEYYDDPDLLQNRPWVQRAVVLSMGVIFNVLLAWGCYFGEIAFGSGLPKPIFDDGAVVTRTPSDDAPSGGRTGLRGGDVVVAMNGRRIAFPPAGAGATAVDSQKAISDFIKSIRETPDGDSIELSVLRPVSNEDVLAAETLATKPLMSGDGTRSNVQYDEVDVSVTPRRADPSSPPTIGVLLAPNYVGSNLIKTSNVFEGAAKAADAVYDVTVQTVSSLGSLFAGLASGGKSGGGQSVSGPIGMIRTGAQVASRNDVSAIIAFMAAVSVNLAVINSLPLPALDGGQLAFVLSEAVSGRKVDQRVQEGINALAILVLLVVTAGTTLGDVGSMLSSSSSSSM